MIVDTSDTTTSENPRDESRPVRPRRPPHTGCGDSGTGAHTRPDWDLSVTGVHATPKGKTILSVLSRTKKGEEGVKVLLLDGVTVTGRPTYGRPTTNTAPHTHRQQEPLRHRLSGTRSPRERSGENTRNGWSTTDHTTPGPGRRSAGRGPSGRTDSPWISDEKKSAKLLCR